MQIPTAVKMFSIRSVDPGDPNNPFFLDNPTLSGETLIRIIPIKKILISEKINFSMV